MGSPPGWLTELLGWTPATTKKTQEKCEKLFGVKLGPNIADRSNGPSMRIATHIYEAIDVPKSKEAEALDADDTDSDNDRESASPSDPGALLEKALEADLRVALQEKGFDRKWLVGRHIPVTKFVQFAHLSEIQAAFDQYPTLRTTFGGDYQIETDVCVGVENATDIGSKPFLHAAISSKWTIRSDRVQNVRHEFVTALIENAQFCSPKVLTCVAPPMSGVCQGV